jgi:hypothetical protein
VESNWVHGALRPAPGDDGKIGGMTGRGNRSTRRKPAPVPLCPSQTPDACPAAAVGSQRLTAWATARHLSNCTLSHCEIIRVAKSFILWRRMGEWGQYLVEYMVTFKLRSNCPRESSSYFTLDETDIRYVFMLSAIQQSRKWKWNNSVNYFSDKIIFYQGKVVL